MKVLNLVTNPDAQFYRQQVATLAERGVTERTVAVPGRRHTTDETAESRSAVEYLRFYPRVLRASLDRPDIVHANYGLTAPAALAQPTRPVVLSLWGSDLLGEYGWLSRACARAADAVVVMTEEMARALGPVESHVIPHGVDLERFRPLDRTYARGEVGWDEAGVDVLFPYPTERPVKDFPRAERVVDTAREPLSTPVRLRTLHDVPHERMPLYLSAADALLLTSKREGSPNSVKEAMACNCPVVATDVGDVAELLDGVGHSHVCRTDEALVDALVAVLGADERSDGRDHVEAYSLARMGDRLFGVYESVL